MASVSCCDYCGELLTPDAWLYDPGDLDDEPHGFCDDGCARGWAAQNFMNDMESEPRTDVQGAGMSTAEVIKFLQEQIDDERGTRADIKDHNCYGAGFSDGVIDALNDVKDFILKLGKYEASA